MLVLGDVWLRRGVVDTWCQVLSWVLVLMNGDDQVSVLTTVEMITRQANLKTLAMQSQIGI